MFQIFFCSVMSNKILSVHSVVYLDPSLGPVSIRSLSQKLQSLGITVTLTPNAGSPKVALKNNFFIHTFFFFFFFFFFAGNFFGIFSFFSLSIQWSKIRLRTVWGLMMKSNR